MIFNSELLKPSKDLGIVSAWYNEWQSCDEGMHLNIDPPFEDIGGWSEYYRIRCVIIHEHRDNKLPNNRSNNITSAELWKWKLLHIYNTDIVTSVGMRHWYRWLCGELKRKTWLIRTMITYWWYWKVKAIQNISQIKHHGSLQGDRKQGIHSYIPTPTLWIVYIVYIKRHGLKRFQLINICNCQWY